MEGRGGAASRLGALLACAIAVASCGSDSSGSSADGVQTRDPASAFAPLVRLAPKERWRPMGARWFLNRSQLWFADDQGCGDRQIAVGRALGDQRTRALNWIFIYGLGKGPTHYDREPYGPTCEGREPYVYYANQQTRPYEETDRARALRLTEGYYVDLMDWAREGPELEREGGEPVVRYVPAFVERHQQDVEGEPGLRLTYWQLYGMNEPLDPQGQPVARLTHEGDWERVDVLAQQGDDDDEWVPVGLRIHSPEGTRAVPWSSVKRTGGDPAGATHPILSAERGSHTLAPASRADCAGCPTWRTWSELSDATTQLWYDFGGAWGEVGSSSETTGPPGPHDGKWPPPRRSSRDY